MEGRGNRREERREEGGAERREEGREEVGRTTEQRAAGRASWSPKHSRAAHLIKPKP